jgi:hypothetical protein
MTAIQFPTQRYPPTCNNFCNKLVRGLLVADEWIQKKVYISTIPINYQESPTNNYAVQTKQGTNNSHPILSTPPST